MSCSYALRSPTSTSPFECGLEEGKRRRVVVESERYGDVVLAVAVEVAGLGRHEDRGRLKRDQGSRSRRTRPLHLR